MTLQVQNATKSSTSRRYEAPGRCPVDAEFPNYYKAPAEADVRQRVVAA
jgi:hypothetical protein